jgi:hypothetical protein
MPDSNDGPVRYKTQRRRIGSDVQVLFTQLQSIGCQTWHRAYVVSHQGPHGHGSSVPLVESTSGQVGSLGIWCDLVGGARCRRRFRRLRYLVTEPQFNFVLE